LNKEVLSHERNSCPCPRRHNEKSPSDHSAIAENLQNKRVFLEKSGVQCIVMPCHILHSWHDEVSKGCSVPFLHMGECVARELKEAKLKPLEAGSPLRIGLLASNATLAAGSYQEKLQNEVISFWGSFSLMYQIILT
jgi:aspartate/glutamate racemase